MELDPLLKVALAIHSNPGVYALLLGSGLSRAAGIPTGWDIVIDLVGKLAALMGEPNLAEPEDWHQRKFGEAAEYSKLLDRLTTTQAERTALLRSYFEPSEEEREQGKKLPTAAHKAIATLVKLGYIRMILTTNFDRLLEQALEAEGIVPDVITSVDGLKGAMPYIHSQVVVVKLHGDYRDTRLLNTSDELAKYPGKVNQFLDRVLDDFGLIICGWSAEWDVALRNALLRCPNRRFACFWTAKGDLKVDAKTVINHRKAAVIAVQGADEFFTALTEKVESLRELERPHPVSAEVAVASVKRYLVDPQHRIRLRDLMHEETERVHREISAAKFSTQVGAVTRDEFLERMRQYEGLVNSLMTMLGTLSYHDEGQTIHLVSQSLERLARHPRQDGKVVWLPLQSYPALLSAYAAGVAALASRRYQNLAAVLLSPQYRDEMDREMKPIVARLNIHSVFERTGKWMPFPDAERRYTPVNDYLFDLLRPTLREFLPDDDSYAEAFDLFEYLLALTYMHLVREEWSPVGRYGWRYNRLNGGWERSPIASFVSNGQAQGSDWDLLKAGFFGGSADRFNEIVAKYGTWLQRVTQGQW